VRAEVDHAAGLRQCVAQFRQRMVSECRGRD
jgi:hypothetical protein